MKLVEMGADANAQGVAGISALHLAARAGAIKICEFLFHEAGALPSLKDIEGRDALDFARLSRDKGTIDFIRRVTPT